MNTFYLRVISSNKIFFEGRVEKIILPLEDGEKAVLAHHENMVIATSIGEIRITTSKGEQVVGVVGEGFVQITELSLSWIPQRSRRISTGSEPRRQRSERKRDSDRKRV